MSHQLGVRKPSSTPSGIGAASELLVSAELMRMGFDVFRNLSPNGAADLVLFKHGRLLTAQVKTNARPWGSSCDVVISWDSNTDTFRCLIPSDAFDLFRDSDNIATAQILSQPRHAREILLIQKSKPRISLTKRRAIAKLIESDSPELVRRGAPVTPAATPGPGDATARHPSAMASEVIACQSSR